MHVLSSCCSCHQEDAEGSALSYGKCFTLQCLHAKNKSSPKGQMNFSTCALCMVLLMSSAEASELKQAAQIIDAQKARLKRELKALEGCVQDATAEKAQAETLVCQIPDAVMADASTEQRTIATQHEQHVEHLHHQSDDLDCQPEKAAEHAQSSAEGREKKQVCVPGFSMSTLPADFALRGEPACCRCPVQMYACWAPWH